MVTFFRGLAGTLGQFLTMICVAFEDVNTNIVDLDDMLSFAIRLLTTVNCIRTMVTHRFGKLECRLLWCPCT